MRIFVALDIDEAIRERITRFIEGLREFAPDLRWMRPESLHVTLKFIGEKSAETVNEIERTLAAIDLPAMELNFRGYGFFPTPKSARVFWIDIETGSALATLATTIDQKLAAPGIAKEEHAYTPHLTLARGGKGSGSPRRQKEDLPNRAFHRMQEKLAALPAPDFGSMTAREFFLYESRLSREGSHYTKLKSLALR